jgi:hypothetical protein
MAHLETFGFLVCFEKGQEYPGVGRIGKSQLEVKTGSHVRRIRGE